MTKWIADRFRKDEGDFYVDPTPKADEKTRKAVTDLGAPRYGKAPDPQTSTDWYRDGAEHAGFEWLKEATFEPTGADNARLFLAQGGFPRTGPTPGSPEYRIAVEDLIHVTRPVPPAELPDVSILREVINGLRAL
ncbi:hypothetical protein ACWCQ0_52080 [Streptomyces massasporeus]